MRYRPLAYLSACLLPYRASRYLRACTCATALRAAWALAYMRGERQRPGARMRAGSKRSPYVSQVMLAKRATKWRDCGAHESLRPTAV